MTVPRSASDDFSIVGGPLDRIGRSTRLITVGGGRIRIGIALALITWVPLAALAVSEWLASPGAPFSFAGSISTHTRLLLAIPLFFYTEGKFDSIVRQVIRLIVQARVVPDDQAPRFLATLTFAARWRDAWQVELVLLGTAVLVSWLGLRPLTPDGASDWRVTMQGELTRAGWWLTMVSLPVFRFLLFRWCARLLVWGFVLWHLGRLRLQLNATHPDRAGGLGGLGIAQAALAPFAFAVSAILVTTYAEQIHSGARTVQDVVLPLVSTLAAITLMLLLPLFLFSTVLMRVRREGLLEYGALATEYVRAFETKWIRSDSPAEPLLGSADVQSLADLGNSYEVIGQMRLAPLSLKQALRVAGAAAVPALPLVLFVVPLDELVLRGIRTLLHV